MSEFAIEKIKAFIIGEMNISDFMIYFNQSDEIVRYLESILTNIEENDIPIKRRIISMKGVAQNQPFAVRSYAESYIKKYAASARDLSNEWKENPPKIGDHLRKTLYQTALGAFTIHATVADIYYQVDQTIVRSEKYHQEYEFSLDVLPSYLAGGVSAENYVSQYILPHFPDSMKKGERKRLVKEEIKKDFLRDCKGYPRWIQSPEWPIGKCSKPMIYTGQKHYENYSEYYFRDIDSDEITTVRQCW